MQEMIKIYKLKDGEREKDEREFWKEQSIEFKISALETIRESYIKINSKNETDEYFKGLRRVLQIVKQK
jgi:hypothetical protein